MAGAYLGWEELLEERGTAAPVDAAPVAPGSAATSPPAGTLSATELLARPDLPEAVRAALQECEARQRELEALTGRAPQDPQDRRDAARFPVPFHTVQTRLAERHARRLEEIVDEARARRRERAALERARLQERTDAAQDHAQREALQQALLLRAAQQRTAAVDATRRKARAAASAEAGWQVQRRQALAAVWARARAEALRAQALEAVQRDALVLRAIALNREAAEAALRMALLQEARCRAAAAALLGRRRDEDAQLRRERERCESTARRRGAVRAEAEQALSALDRRRDEAARLRAQQQRQARADAEAWSRRRDARAAG